jgi:glucosamine--fructose-6-phosphate aminotransferase (isomerizing)
MCGIICRSGPSVSIEKLLHSLERIEYRGYDSVGISVISREKVQVFKSLKTLALFADEAKTKLPKEFKVGVGHTRWATHGGVTIENAHPITINGISIVHNGIISNIAELKKRFPFTYLTQTDSEFLLRYIDFETTKGSSLQDTLFKLTAMIEGESAFIVISERFDSISAAVAKDSSLVLSIRDGELIIGSDVYSIAPVDRYHRLDNSILFFKNGVFNDEPVLKLYSYDREPLIIKWKNTMSVVDEKQLKTYSSYFKKEINEQSTSLQRVLESASKCSETIKDVVKKSQRVILYGSGSAYNAALWGSYLFRKLGKEAIAVQSPESKSYSAINYDLAIAISQSGETMDTIKAFKLLKAKRTLSIVNREESTLAHMSELMVPLCVGEEVSVASSKTFTAQIAMLYILSGSPLPPLELAIKRVEAAIGSNLPSVNAKFYMFVGRDTTYPLALEGALKLKELSYIPAEGLSSGELKHGPIALVDSSIVTIALEPFEDATHFRSILDEISARGGKTLELKNLVKTNSEIERALVYTILIQKFAMSLAESLGRNIDKPRNLAKSVTVI